MSLLWLHYCQKQANITGCSVYSLHSCWRHGKSAPWEWTDGHQRSECWHNCFWLQLCGVWRGCSHITLHLVGWLWHDSANPVLFQAPCADVWPGAVGAAPSHEPSCGCHRRQLQRAVPSTGGIAHYCATSLHPLASPISIHPLHSSTAFGCAFACFHVGYVRTACVLISCGCGHNLWSDVIPCTWKYSPSRVCIVHHCFFDKHEP